MHRIRIVLIWLCVHCSSPRRLLKALENSVYGRLKLRAAFSLANRIQQFAKEKAAVADLEDEPIGEIGHRTVSRR